MQLTKREYETFLTHHDARRVCIPKIRRCFNYGQQYYQLDEYLKPLPPHSPCQVLSHTYFFISIPSVFQDRLIILETYTTRRGDDITLPRDFIVVDREITGEFTFTHVRLHEFSLACRPARVLHVQHGTKERLERLDTAEQQRASKERRGNDGVTFITATTAVQWTIGVEDAYQHSYRAFS